MTPVHLGKLYWPGLATALPPGPKVIQLFDQAIHAIERAQLGFQCAHHGERNAIIQHNLQRAVDAIQQLHRALDLKSGGELADTLHYLYRFFERRLKASQQHKSRQGADEVIPMLRNLRAAWADRLQRSPGADCGWLDSPVRRFSKGE